MRNERRRMMMGDKKLPYDAEIEYLESSGTQWIDTLIVPNSNFSFEVEVMKSDNTETLPLGTWNAWENAMFGISLRHSFNDIIMTWGSTSVSINIIKNTWLKLSEKNGEQKVVRLSDGYIYRETATTETFTCLVSAYLFANHLADGRSAHKGPCKIAKAVIKNGDTVVFDVFPVRVGNIGYMYDKVSGQLFGNAGTGEFILGPDK